MTGPLIAVLDYGIGNLRSAQKALEHVGADARLTADHGLIADAAGVVLPGVGAFGRCMDALHGADLADVAVAAAADARPFMGICVGMQLLYESSDENPGVAGLGVLPGPIRRLPADVKVPQMQWNVLDTVRPSPLLAGLPPEPWVYFVHSFAAEDSTDAVATCDYGGPVVAAVERGNVWATQFHPEKSAANGLRILGNFVATCGGVLMQLFPAIDLRDGHCVRLTQGDFDRETVYGDDPVAQARVFADAGAEWIHVVDLDAARTGDPVNRPVVAAIAAGVRCAVQTGGGVRDDAAAEALLESGVRRVVVGTAALEDPALVERLTRRYPGQVALGLDVRGTEVAVRGWQEGSGRDLFDVAAEFADVGVDTLIVTQIHVDGMLSGPDIEGLLALLAGTDLEIVASGGVGTLDHLRTLAHLRVGDRGLAGAIVGRALYEGAFTIDEALAASATEGGVD